MTVKRLAESLMDHYGVKGAENKDVSKARVKDRYFSENNLSVKASLRLIAAGIISAALLTAFEYANKKLGAEGWFNIFLKAGFGISLLGAFCIPYGLYNLIAGFGYGSK